MSLSSRLDSWTSSWIGWWPRAGGVGPYPVPLRPILEVPQGGSNRAAGTIHKDDRSGLTRPAARAACADIMHPNRIAYLPHGTHHRQRLLSPTAKPTRRQG